MIISYGICCSRFKDNKYELLFIKKRFSYAYSEFIAGNYSSHNKIAIRVLFNKMTADEKNIILSYNFEYIYYYAYLKNKRDIQDKKILKKYQESENKFYKTFTLESLKNLMTGTSSVHGIWEFPKGRGRAGENNIESAIREFEEETGISSYYFLNNEAPLECILDKNYKYILYHAICNRYFTPSFNADLNYEVLEMEWMCLEKAKFLLNKELLHVAKLAIKIAKHNFKKINKL